MKHGVLHWTRKTYVTVCLMTLSIVSIQAQAIDLLTFGRACLSQEKELNTKHQAVESDELKRLDELMRYHNDRVPGSRYDEGLSELKQTLDYCSDTDPNSGYCHRVRMRYNEIKYNADKAKEEDFGDWSDSALLDMDPRFDREALQYDYERFEALCRDSDAHYELLNDPDAYQAVCGSASAKQTQTCSFTG